MDNQFHDTILFDGDQYDIIKVNGTGMVTPRMFGMYPEAIGGGCAREFLSRYAVVDGFLILTDMQVGPVPGENYRKLGGRLPDPDRCYRAINLWSRFTGSLLVTRGRTALDVLFQDGELLLSREANQPAEPTGQGGDGR